MSKLKDINKLTNESKSTLNKLQKDYIFTPGQQEISLKTKPKKRDYLSTRISTNSSTLPGKQLGQDIPVEDRMRAPALQDRKVLAYVLSAFAQFGKAPTIQAFIKHQFHKSIALESLYNVERKFKKEIKAVREDWLTKIADEPGAHKRVRLQVLWDMIERLQGAFLGIKKNDEKIISKYAQVTKAINDIMNSVRIEIEGNTLNVTGTILHRLDDNQLVETAQDSFKKLNLAAKAARAEDVEDE